MALDLETLLAPVAGDDPAGPDLAYDPQRHMIEEAFDAPVSIDASGVASADTEVDWRAIIAAISDQSLRTKDLWLAVYLIRAGARSGRIATVAAGAQMLAGLLERFWPMVHPRLEEYGFEARKGACDTLTQFREFPAPFGRIVMIDHQRLGRFSVDDLIRFHRSADRDEDYGVFRAALAEEPVERLNEALRAITAIRDGVARTDAVLMTHAGSAVGSNFTAIYELLKAAETAIGAFLPHQTVLEEGAADVVSGDGPTQGRHAGGTIQSREDVVRMLDLLIAWYGRHEPVSPVPLLLERAKTWVPLDFLAVLRDIAPSAVDDARRILNAQSSS